MSNMFVAHYSSMLYSTGPPESLVVTPNGEDITVENNSSLQIQVQVQDKAGNLTVQPRLNVVCKVILTLVVSQNMLTFIFLKHNLCNLSKQQLNYRKYVSLTLI